MADQDRRRLEGRKFVYKPPVIPAEDVIVNESDIVTLVEKWASEENETEGHLIPNAVSVSDEPPAGGQKGNAHGSNPFSFSLEHVSK